MLLTVVGPALGEQGVTKVVLPLGQPWRLIVLLGMGAQEMYTVLLVNRMGWGVVVLEPSVVEPAVVEPAVVESAVVESAVVEPVVVDGVVVDGVVVDDESIKPVLFDPFVVDTVKRGNKYLEI